MISGRIKKANKAFITRFPVTLPTMGWYFSSTIPKGAIEMPAGIWTCMFEYLEEVANGQRICFSESSVGCAGASCYLGCSETNLSAEASLSSTEKHNQDRIKKPKGGFLILGNIENMENDIKLEVVNYWIKPLSLAGLVTLSNYDNPGNNNVNIPFTSGCQSMWTIPYREKEKKLPKATIGALDPAMRKFIASDTLLFSVPANRFYVMASHIKRSFACQKSWLDLIGSNTANQNIVVEAEENAPAEKQCTTAFG